MIDNSRKTQPDKNLMLGCIERSLVKIKQELLNMEHLFEQKEVNMDLYIKYQKWAGKFETMCETETDLFLDLVNEKRCMDADRPNKP